MRVQLMALEAVPFTNRNTGEVGTEYRLQVHDGDGVRTVRLPEDKFNELRNVPVHPFDQVDLSFAFVSGRFGQHFVAIDTMTPAKS